MATILDLYKDATKNKVENEIYGKSSILIESRGVINIPRQVALLASSPNAVADLIGGQVAGLLGGNATYPSDTIFKDNKPFTKPVTILGGIAIEKGKIKDVIDPETNYYVKQSPNPTSFIQKINQGVSNPSQAAANIAADALRNPLATKNAFDKLKDKIQNKSNNDTSGYGDKFTIENGKPKNEKITFSTHLPTYKNVNTTKVRNYDQSFAFTGTEKRNQTANLISWDTFNNKIIRNEATNSEAFYTNNITRVEIKKYGTNEIVYLPGTITGLSEDFSPEWNGFKYVGSPFNVYRYSGVERSIKFNLKLYYTDSNSKKAMIKNLDFLKTLVHPYEELSTITYGSGSAQTAALAFSPNLVEFSITGLYTKLFGFVEELGISIEDNTSWATIGNESGSYMSGTNEAPYPTIFDISLGFKIIPNIKIENNKYIYDFNNGNTIT